MKRLFVITAILAFTVSSVGCRSCRPLWRGWPWQEQEPPQVITEVPCCNPNPCNTCEPSACSSCSGVIMPTPGATMTGVTN